MINETSTIQGLSTLINDNQHINKKNKFESLGQFKEFVTTSFIEGSGIDINLFRHCIEYHEDLETYQWGEVEMPIHEGLNWDFPRSRWQANEPIYAAFLKNEDGTIWQAILSLWDEDRQRPYRYLAPKQNGDRAFLPPIPATIRKRISSRYGVEIPMNGSFWEWLEKSPLPRIITEGGKKGLAALTQGYIAIALYGCRCGAKTKNADGEAIPATLIPDIARFHQEGSMWLLGFDRDEKTKAKADVTAGKKRLTHTLHTTNRCYVEDIFWKSEQGKGLDDLIMTSGSGAFDSAYAKAIGRLEKQFRPTGRIDENDHDRKPSQLAVARKIAENYRNLLAFNNEITSWMRYGADYDGMWSCETDEYIESVVYQIILSEGCENFSSSFVSSVIKILRHELIERTWGERSPKELLPFRNGILNVTTGELLPHAPGYRLTWQLPRDYAMSGEWNIINEFLDHLAGGNTAIKDLLLCYCNAVLKGRGDLQKFLHLIGLGGTGKGTFSRLIINLIGAENVHTTTLEEWCQNRFDGANAYRKRLVLFPDEDRQQGKLGKFLSLTGQDLIRAEEKSKKAFQYRFDGMVLVMSNFPIFGGDSAMRIKRRVVTVPCNNPVSPNQIRDLEAEFQPELSAFTNYVLTIPDEHVTKVLRGIVDIPECTLEFWENRIRVDSVAAWVNQNVICDQSAVTPIGCSRHEGSNGENIVTLFGSYTRHCHNVGDVPKSHKNFSPDLIELCRSVMGWEIERTVTKTGKFIRGLRLRIIGQDDHLPTYDYHLMERVRAGDGRGDGRGDGSEPLLDKAVTVGDGSGGDFSENFQPVDIASDHPTQIEIPPITERSLPPKFEREVNGQKVSFKPINYQGDTLHWSIEWAENEIFRSFDMSKASASMDEFIAHIEAIASKLVVVRPPEDTKSRSKSKKEITVTSSYYCLHLGLVVKVYAVDRVLVCVKLPDGKICTVKRSQLYPLPSDNWEINIGNLVDYAGEIRGIVGYDSTKKEYQLEDKLGRWSYAKAKALGSPEI